MSRLIKQALVIYPKQNSIHLICVKKNSWDLKQAGTTQQGQDQV